MNEIEEEFSFRRLAKKPGKNTSFGTIPSAPFPTLKVSLLRKHGFLQQDIPINSKNSLMFETDLFVGKMVLLMQPSDPEDGLHKLQYDLYYVKNHSLFLDFVILFETVGVVLTGKGAQ